MCYFLYGSVNEQAYDNPFLSICKKHEFACGPRINPRYILFKSDIKNGVYFRFANGHCDCGTPIGDGDANAKELFDYIKWLKELNKCRKKLKAFYVIKYWEGGDSISKLKPTVTVHIDDVDAEYLANIKDDTPYRIEYFKRYDK